MTGVSQGGVGRFQRCFYPAFLLGASSLALLYFLLACWCFARVHCHAIRTGLIARYSAETLS